MTRDLLCALCTSSSKRINQEYPAQVSGFGSNKSQEVTEHVRVSGSGSGSVKMSVSQSVKKIEVWRRGKLKIGPFICSSSHGKLRRDLGATMWRLQHRIPCIIMAVHGPSTVVPIEATHCGTA